jgi:predicted lipoprotein with Yx(FWY)xxD motif
MRPMLAVPFLIVSIAVAATGCGSDDGDAGAPEAANAATPESPATSDATAPERDAPAAPAKKKKKGPVIRVQESEFGPVLIEKKSGLVAYAFTRENQGGKPRCYGGCADAWPPILAKGKPRAGSGVDDDLLGRAKRRNGDKIVTYDGRPLYFYVDDSPGVILCNNVFEFGGHWLVIAPDGTLGGS